ncbi:MAG: hypothetical protein GY779_11465, partial [Gammaproteobacteria bacterium]|nr:hypothetical protein [Gammaproteobacteria bacterium]
MDRMLQNDLDALADNNDGGADEDALSAPLTIAAGDSLTVDCVGTGTVNGWIDFNGNGQFDTTEMATSTEQCSATTANKATLIFPAVSDALIGTSYLRLRIASNLASIAAPSGLAMDGEVEDHRISVVVYTDYGDAPLAYGEASHQIISDFSLGTNNDHDTGNWGDGTDDNSNATDDDTVDDPTGGINDEDGLVAGTAPTVDTLQATYDLEVSVTNTINRAATVYGWIDFDLSGTFDSDERAMVAATSTGNVTLNFTVPTDAAGNGNSYVRLRLC